jgi:hypothetical protein
MFNIFHSMQHALTFKPFQVGFEFHDCVQRCNWDISHFYTTDNVSEGDLQKPKRVGTNNIITLLPRMCGQRSAQTKYLNPVPSRPTYTAARSFTRNLPQILIKTLPWIMTLLAIYNRHNVKFRPSRWPRGLRRGSAAARLLGLRVRIPPRAWMFVVSVVRFQVEVSASGRSLVQRSPTECGVSECDNKSLIMRSPWPTRGCCAVIKTITWYFSSLLYRSPYCTV